MMKLQSVKFVCEMVRHICHTNTELLITQVDQGVRSHP